MQSWDDEDIFESESFSGVFNTFVNQWCVKKDKNVFKLPFRFHAFSEIPAVLRAQEEKKN